MSKSSAAIALLFFVPAFSIGVIFSIFIAPGIIGNSIFTAMKVWAVVFPLGWTVKYNSQALRLPKFTWQEVGVGLGLGILMFGAIISAYLLIGQQIIDLTTIRAKATEVGITSLTLYLAGCVYWSFINSLIEEYTWRGFVVSRCKVLFPDAIAVILAALFFTTHHSIALYGYTHSWSVVLLGSLGVFIAGIVWAGLYDRYQSIIPGWIAHILADIAIASVGYQLLFV